MRTSSAIAAASTRREGRIINNFDSNAIKKDVAPSFAADQFVDYYD